MGSPPPALLLPLLAALLRVPAHGKTRHPHGPPPTSTLPGHTHTHPPFSPPYTPVTPGPRGSSPAPTPPNFGNLRSPPVRRGRAPGEPRILPPPRYPLPIPPPHTPSPRWRGEREPPGARRAGATPPPAGSGDSPSAGITGGSGGDEHTASPGVGQARHRPVGPAFPTCRALRAYTRQRAASRFLHAVPTVGLGDVGLFLHPPPPT